MATKRARGDEAWACCEQVGRDAAALLLREGVPSSPGGQSGKRGIPSPERAWNFNRFWIDSDGSFLVKKSEQYWVNRWTPFPSTRTRTWLEHVPAGDLGLLAIGYSAPKFGDAMPTRYGNYDGDSDHRLDHDVASNLRLLLQGKSAEYSPE